MPEAGALRHEQLDLLPTPRNKHPVPVRSTGASEAIGQLAPVVGALGQSGIVVDCTLEGLMHAPELHAILQGNGQTQPRIVYVSNEHPEALVRLLPDDATEARVKTHVKRLRGATRMRVTSVAGTDLHPGLRGCHRVARESGLPVRG